mgnify:CR=1 FL=1
MTTITKNTQFSISVQADQVGPASVAVSKTNVQRNERNILGVTGPSDAQGRDFLHTPNVPLSSTPGLSSSLVRTQVSSFTHRMNQSQVAQSVVAPTRIHNGAPKGTSASIVLANTKYSNVAFGSVQLPACGYQTNDPETGNKLSHPYAPLAPKLPGLANAQDTNQASALIGAIFGSAAREVGSGDGIALDGDIMVQEFVCDNGPAENIPEHVLATTADPAEINSGGYLRCVLTGVAGALTMDSTRNRVRYAPEFFGNESGNGSTGVVYNPFTTDGYSKAAVTAQTTNPSLSNFYSNQMELGVPYSSLDQPGGANVRASIVWRYRAANSPLRPGEPEGTAVGGFPLIEIVALCPFSVSPVFASNLAPPS